jgi:hypothetical protein
MVQRIIASTPIENQYLHLRKTDSHLRAEIKISSDDLGYQFRLRQIDENRGCFFVNKNSSVLKLLDIGSVMDMKYWRADKTRKINHVRAEINNITKQNHEPFKGHYKISLSILKTKDLKLVSPAAQLLKAPFDVNDTNRSQQGFEKKNEIQSEVNPRFA